MLQQIIILLLGLLSQLTPLEIKGDAFLFSSEKERIGLENQNAKGAKELKSVNVWEKLSQAGVTDLGSKVDEIKSIANKYLDDLPNTNIADEIAQAGSYRTWYDTKVLGKADELAGVGRNADEVVRLLDDPASINKIADDIINLNKQTEGGGVILSGSPKSALNTASYYATVPEQGASIFKTIIKNHMFADGNKRTAVEAFKLFCSRSGIKNSLTDLELLKVASDVATGKLDDVLEISKVLIK